MKDPFWKRSAFGTFIKDAASILILWWIDGLDPSSASLIGLVTTLLLVMGYQMARPTQAAPPK